MLTLSETAFSFQTSNNRETLMQRPKKDYRQIGTLLVEAGYISGLQLDRAVEAQKKTKKRLGETLVELGFVSELGIAVALSTQLGIPFIDFETAVADPAALDLIPEKLAEKHRIFPLNLEKGVLTVVMADPLNFEALKDVGFAVDRNFEPAVSTATEIKKAIERYYHLSGPVHEILDKMGTVEVLPEKVDPAEVEEAARKGESPPIIRMVNNIIFSAVRNRASDIHIEPRKNSVAVRERVDGLLGDVFELPKWAQGPVTSRLKILARLDIAEKRIPQDGRIKMKMEGREVDLRISILPIQYGESVVIRILDTQASVLGLPEIGLSQDGYRKALAMVSKPQGLVLVTGPTGSGKTSTLYAMINGIKKPSINIISLEDPVEYELGGVKQVSINEKTGLTFAYGLRSVLRQDPDVIMVGEMRDQETAQIAMQSSLTGHLVLSTLHTNTAVAAVTRLRDMGIQPYLLASSINGVIAQRLVRKLCVKCREAHEPTDEDLVKLGLKKSPGKGFFRARGCPECRNTGYRGRAGVFEVLVFNARIRELISGGAAEDEIRKAAVDGGLKFISEDGAEKARAGVTSVEELLRVLYVDEEEALGSCAHCGEYIKPDFMSCPYCGFLMAGRCPDCGRPKEKGWKFCPWCRR